MGIDVGGRRSVNATINITPLVDVVLVLLIIFMVVVPAVQRQIPVEVPPQAPPGTVSLEPPLQVLVQPDLSLVVEDRGTRNDVRAVDLAETLRQRLASRGASSTVFVDVAPEVSWRDAVGVMDTIRGVGRADHAVTVAIAVDAVDVSQ
jgi:biopolymer transport protein ExbD